MLQTVFSNYTFKIITFVSKNISHFYWLTANAFMQSINFPLIPDISNIPS